MQTRQVELMLAAAMTAGITVAAEPPRLPVWPAGKMPAPQTKAVGYDPYYAWWAPTNLTTDAILICCGGGGYYGCATGGFETRPLVHYLNAKGMTAVEFKYRAPRLKAEEGPKHLLAWQDAQRVIRIVRHEAKKRGLNPDKIGFTGCSAGGHLTIMTAVSSTTNAYALIGDEIDRESCRLNFAVPVYPAYGMSDAPDKCSRSDDLSVPLVPEFLFDHQTPPMCFFHGDTDAWTPMTSFRCWHKLRTLRKPAELHIFTQEGHCFQMWPFEGSNADNWKDILWGFLVRLDFVTQHPRRWSYGGYTMKGEPWQGVPIHVYAKDTNGVFCAAKSWCGDGMGCGYSPVLPGSDLRMGMKLPDGDCEIDFDFNLMNGGGTSVFVGDVELAIPAGAYPNLKRNRTTLYRKGNVVTGFIDSKPIDPTWFRPAPERKRDEFVLKGFQKGEGCGRFHWLRWRKSK